MENNKSVAVTPEYIETYKFEKWVEYYTDDKNPKTYSNAIQSVFAAYGTNMTYGAASNIAVDNNKKFRYMRRAFAEKAGFTFDKFQKMTIAKFAKGNDPRWYDKVKEVTGFSDLIPEENSKGTGISVKTENKDGTISEIKIISFDQPKDQDKE